MYRMFNPYITLVDAKPLTNIIAREILLPPLDNPVRFDTGSGEPIEMHYLLQPIMWTKGVAPILVLRGVDQHAGFSTVILGTCSPGKVTSAMMKRCHTIAQGKPPNACRDTDSHIWGVWVYDGILRDAQYNWYWWTELLTSEQGYYPTQQRVKWTTPPGCEYYVETGIELDTR